MITSCSICLRPLPRCFSGSRIDYGPYRLSLSVNRRCSLLALLPGCDARTGGIQLRLELASRIGLPKVLCCLSGFVLSLAGFDFKLLGSPLSLVGRYPCIGGLSLQRVRTLFSLLHRTPGLLHRERLPYILRNRLCT